MFAMWVEVLTDLCRNPRIRATSGDFRLLLMFLVDTKGMGSYIRAATVWGRISFQYKNENGLISQLLMQAHISQNSPLSKGSLKGKA